MTTLDADAERRVRDLLYDVVREDEIPGLSVAVTDGAETLFADGVGSRDLASNAPATPETVYGVASCTKSFVALAVLQLVDRGDLALDDPVTDHLDVAVPDDVTVHHLLTHSSGYPSLGVSETLIDRQTGEGETGVPLGDLDDFHHHLAGAREERAADPGERFAYCNTGYTLVGEVVEAVDGRPLAEYLAAEILSPVGMERSTLDPAQFAAIEDRMTPYWSRDDGPEASSVPERELSVAPGGLFAPVTDLAAYLRVHLGGGETPGGDRLVSESHLQRAYEDHAETPDGPYGYGWRTMAAAGRDLVGHSGSIGVSSAYVGFCEAEDLGVALAANTSPDYVLAVLGQAVLAAALGADPESVPWLARRRRFDRYVGSYESYRGIRQARVDRDGEFLRLIFEDAFGGEVPLVPADGTGEDGSFWTLTPSGNRDEVRFVETDAGVDLLYDRWRLHRE